jgi:hypothetical protein
MEESDSEAPMEVAAEETAAGAPDTETSA